MRRPSGLAPVTRGLPTECVEHRVGVEAEQSEEESSCPATAAARTWRSLGLLVMELVRPSYPATRDSGKQVVICVRRARRHPASP